LISRLAGKLLERVEGNSLLVDVRGIGYEVEVASSVLMALPEVGGDITLHTHFVVREDAQLLFGFASKSERDLFRALIKINKVGPKLGLAIISSLDLEALRFVVNSNDPALLTKVPGIGKATAERILVELKNRFDSLASVSAPEFVVVETDGSAAVAHEAQGALVALGYKPQEASQAVRAALRAANGDVGSAEELVRSALRTFDKATG
jgi:Holliday junction DNA helicase RuvA